MCLTDPSETETTHRSVWRIGEYRRLWLGTAVMMLANQAEHLAVGWAVLANTDSVFLAAASYAVRKIPGSLIAPVAGDASDRLSPRRLLVATSLYKSVIVLLLGWLSLDDFELIWAVFVLAALSGVGRSFETPATQKLITDIVPKEMILQGVALQGTGTRAVGALGALLGGFVIHSIGTPAVLFGGAGVLVIGAAIIWTLPARSLEREGMLRGSFRDDFNPGGDDSERAVAGGPVFSEAFKGLIWLMKRPVVRSLLWAAFIVEMFGFAYNALLPSIARDVLNLGADGLGELTFAAGMGSMSGAAVLAAANAFHRKGLLFIGITFVYGIFLVGFAMSGIFSISLVLIVGVGASAGMFDTMQMTLLQQHVPNDVRGRAIGGWVFAVNFAWMGQMVLGYVTESVGVQWALAGAGGLVIATGLAAVLVSPGLRRA
jgi:MFS family permease